MESACVSNVEVNYVKILVIYNVISVYQKYVMLVVMDQNILGQVVVSSVKEKTVITIVAIRNVESIHVMDIASV